MTGTTETAYAKVNLALHVRRRRPDGYHDIESLFAFCEDGDGLTARRRDDGAILLRIEGPFTEGLEAGEGNLVVRAARALQAATGAGWGADLLLTKNVPVASGIGGGSADAAAALRLLDRLWETRLGEEQLIALGDPLGSDVPACVASRTLVGTGRGDALRFVAGDDLAGMPILLVNPGAAVATGPVFGAWDGVDRGALNAVDWRAGRNDLADPAMRLAPMIGAVLDALAALPGIDVARMSGSGATCFALFAGERARDEAQAVIRAAHPDWWTMASRLR
ncbi:4-(cytidine 5'-diphospho)-2-C-methyl-D-erythritol kinase [Sphingobium subterraneum]|uniref:4-diphosphocytidyl-2-C-methyl-D-erythritol kinase n=1 Tax=Sphingobium subterraneum TaxID=627688 RepID=A0A841IYB1_9SPHN|nr:4-(cytidine 5'-diphospho)-2-C-methyl-D-erythritol kinase [Sphingobium subterraneum]MBB6123653.1 4-diphosphocytidyl-2-C-methyl-D-erythritol kinase [Sphingobium subterraneum]